MYGGGFFTETWKECLRTKGEMFGIRLTDHALLHSGGLVPSVNEVTPGLSDASITHHLHISVWGVTGLGKV